MVMRTLLGLILTASLLLTGCSDDETPVAEDPAPSVSDGPSDGPTSTGPVEFEVVGMVSETAVGGKVSPTAVDLRDPDGLAHLTGQFEDDRMTTKLEAVIKGADVPEGDTLLGAVVAVGCIPPTDVLVEKTERGLQVTAVPDKRDASTECLAPVTTVAVVSVEGSFF